MHASTSPRARRSSLWGRRRWPTRALPSASRVSWRVEDHVAELIIAFDVPSGREALALAGRLPGLTWAKLGHVLFAREGPAAARAAGPDLPLVGVTVLTSHDAAELESVLGRGVPDIGFESERLARMAVQAGLRGVVASGQELGLLREALGPVPWIVVPGLRMPGDAAGDQARTIGPDDAVRRGATHLVVGRPITAARDPVAAYRRLAEAIGSGVSERA